MNVLLAELRRSLVELDLGLAGDLTMTAPMEALMHALAEDRVPAPWAAVAYPSLRGLGSWMQNLLQRVQQLSEWTADMQVPKSVWLSGLFNPQSFLTAVMQVGEGTWLAGGFCLYCTPSILRRPPALALLCRRCVTFPSMALSAPQGMCSMHACW